MRGLEVTSIFKSMWENNLVVSAISDDGQERHLFSVSMDGINAQRMLVERKGGSPQFASKHISDEGFNIETGRWGFGESHDTASGLYAMRQYRKIRQDVIDYVLEQRGD